MIYLKYILIFFSSWIISVIIGGIIGAIFNSNKSKIGGFIAGLIIPFTVVFLVSKVLLEKNSENKYDLLPIILILIPYILINTRALYNSGVQDGSGNNKFGVTGIEMKVNKGLVVGGLIGSVLTLYCFVQYSF
ncbi:hypothetical protein [Flavobacterium dankookense]|uniref:Uncharacterized protein n=1 Tax=Flavobacterium dankookense TaxID=706186 RepID=A0A4R6Q5S8_9FLAO|nr:hypothetical protein [Flavobacterium dankookense]TDP57385.1 hypothetical protein BC748_2905 [Flavobacterium dankookense]